MLLIKTHLYCFDLLMIVSRILIILHIYIITLVLTITLQVGILITIVLFYSQGN